MNKSIRWIGPVGGAVAMLAVCGMGSPASAKGKGNPTGGAFAEKHPRRNEVNQRVDRQRERIEKGEKSGKLTQEQADQLRANDRAIKEQEHAEVKANGGHLTPAEKKQLNREENANSRLIREEKHPAK